MILEPTELDAAIIAEEAGWDYLPACDEGAQAVDRYFESFRPAESVKLRVDERDRRETGNPTDPSAENRLPVRASDKPERKINRRRLRILATRKVIAMYQDDPDLDWQQAAFDLLNDPELAAYWEGRTQDETDDLCMGLVRFGEWTRGGDSRS
jgi:hypothetical protein